MRAIERERKARLEAEAANLRKEQDLAIVSHELRAALNGILAWSEMLAAGDLTIDETPAAAAAIHRQAIRQARLLDDLLAVSRATLDFSVVPAAPVDVRGLLASVVEAIQPIARSAGIRVDTTSRDAAHVMGDAVRLHQVLANLLDNALKFTGAGGSVRIDVSVAAGMVTIEVANTGAGIDADFLPHVFERFRHRDPSDHAGPKGLGLGLFIAREIVTRHGGTIAAQSRGAGFGATFTVSLPATTPAGATTAPARSSAGVKGTDFRAALQESGVPQVVLIVDNDRETLVLYEKVFSAAGFRVCSAREAAEAIDYARARQPDAIITDLRLPGAMDGLALIRELRADPALRAVPILAVTGHPPCDSPAMEMATLLLKPLSPRTLVAYVRSALAQARKP